jgi:DNA-binding transcriptional regulator PaaX
MADEEILKRIRTLVEEEHAVRSGDAVDEERLAHLEETLDQCWDLLRQRRARREFGDDPSEAQVRGTGTVEHYQQ